MEELFELLEESGEQGPETVTLRSQVGVPLRAEADVSVSGKVEESGVPDLLEQEQGMQKAKRPGDVAQLLLGIPERDWGSRSRSYELVDAWVNEWMARELAETIGAEVQSQTQSGGGGDETQSLKWYQGIGNRQTGVQRLYQGINAPRLRSVEHRAQSVVVQLSEPERRETAGLTSASARELDRVFQRDARRYDGGLSLL